MPSGAETYISILREVLEGTTKASTEAKAALDKLSDRIDTQGENIKEIKATGERLATALEERQKSSGKSWGMMERYVFPSIPTLLLVLILWLSGFLGVDTDSVKDSAGVPAGVPAAPVGG